jgi:hypothetical protein
MVDHKDGDRSATYRQLNDLKIYLAAALLVLTVVLFAVVATGGFGDRLRVFLIAILPNVATALVAYLVIEFFLARRGMGGSELLQGRLDRSVRDAVHQAMNSSVVGVTNVYGDLGEVPWGTFFAAAQEDVVIVARFFDGPLMQLEKELPALFERGVRVRMLAPDPTNRALVAAMNAQRGITEDNKKTSIADRIRSGVNQVLRAHASANGTGSVELYLYDEMLSYSAVCIDGRTLLFAPSEQVFAASSRAPRFELDLAVANQAFRRFWEHEVAELLTGARRVDDLPPAKAPARSRAARQAKAAEAAVGTGRRDPGGKA